MSITLQLSALALRPVLKGACQLAGGELGAGAAEKVLDVLTQHFTDRSQRLPKALDRANARAWKAVEVALAGESWWRRLADKGEDRAFRQQVRAFLDAAPLDNRLGEEYRAGALGELRRARQAGTLAPPGPDPAGLARRTADFARFADPQALVEADWQTLDAIADELRQAGYATLARFLRVRPAGSDGPPLLAVAARYFFRREVEADETLFRGLTLERLDHLAHDQEAGFAALADALAEHGRQLDGLLAATEAVHVDVLDVKSEQQRQGQQLQELHRAIMQALAARQLDRRPLQAQDSLSIRNDAERELVKQLVGRYRALPDERRRELPALLDAVGKLEVMTGAFDQAQQDFQRLAALVEEPGAKAEAHDHAARAALERRDWPTALQETLAAARLAPDRFAPFPLEKYAPERILGAGGFGTAFLCRDRHSGGQVVIKALRAEGLGVGVADVFREAAALEGMDHPGIIRLRHCDYADPGQARPYLVMDYFAGTPLADLVAREGPLSVAELLPVACQIAEALQAAHAKAILHRDVKPANVLVRRVEGRSKDTLDGWKVKLIDFGLAQSVTGLRETVNRTGHSDTMLGGSVAGTIDYAAPEQMGKLLGVSVGPPADVYGFARTCCFAMFQTPQPLPKHWKRLPPRLAELLEGCLAEDPSERPPDFGRISGALRLAMAQGPGPTVLVAEAVERPPVGPPRHSSATMRRTLAPPLPPAPAVTRRAVRVPEEPPRRRRSGLLWLMILLGGLLLVTLPCFGVVLLLRPIGGGSATRPAFPPPPDGVGIPGFPWPAAQGPVTKATIVFSDIPNARVEDYIRARLQALAGKDDQLTLPPGKGGKPLEVAVEGRDLLGLARKLEVGIVSEDGGKIRVEVRPPAMPTPAAPPQRKKLSAAEIKKAIAGLEAPNGPSGFGRDRAAAALVDAEPDPAYRKQLLAALHPLLTPDGAYKPNVVKAAGTWGDKETIKLLLHFLEKNTHPELRGHALDELGKLRAGEAADFLVNDLKNFFAKGHAFKTLQAIGPPAEKGVIAGLSSPDPGTRHQCCQILREIGTKESIPTLQTLTKDKDGNVAAAAWDAWKVIAFRPDSWPPPVPSVVVGPEPPESPEEIGAPRPEPPKAFLRFTAIPTPAVADFIAARLRGTLQADQTAEIETGKPEGTVTATVANCTDGLALARQLELGTVAEDGDRWRIEVRPPLLPTPPAPPQRKKVPAADIQKILTAMAKGDGVGGHDINANAAGLIDIEPDPVLRKKVLAALHPLIVPDRSYRPNVIKAAGTWGDEKTIQLLLHFAQKSGHPELQGHAVAALGNLKAAEAAEFLITEWNAGGFRPGPATTALEQIGAGAEKALLAALSSPNSGTRVRACRVLRVLGTPTAIPTLRTAVKDKDGNVAAAAWDAWKVIVFRQAAMTKPAPK